MLSLHLTPEQIEIRDTVRESSKISMRSMLPHAPGGGET